jgi:lipopolysaccharide/colanic/teichoic acid biosynthesis glycosyltransferase
MTGRLLLVDDDAEVGTILKTWFARDNYLVDVALDGPSALEVAEAWKPDIILLDIIMPDMDGFTVLEELRRREATAKTPIILLSALSQFKDKERGYASGADDYVTKPMDLPELRLRVAAMLRRVQVSSEHARYRPDSQVALPLVLTRHRSGVFRKGYQLSKRAFDIVLSFFGLLALLPFLLFIALMIRLDSPGPVLFGHRRVGINGKMFTMYKFRTMVKNAEELKEQSRHLNEMNWPAFKIANDPRITRVGRLLRRTSLDELPQLFNVLKGDMSIVGPRPHSWGIDTYRPWQTERLEVPPGMTGLWQVSGRNEIADFGDWVEMDIEYIERQSWRLDLTILIQTAAAVLTGRGAH